MTSATAGALVGLGPVITTAAYVSTHSLSNALVYPIVVPAVAFLLALFLMPETRKISIWRRRTCGHPQGLGTGR